jgi:hypothetical protein
MNTFFPFDDIEFHKTFGIILSIENFSSYINELTELIHTNELDKRQLNRILSEHHIKQIEDIKEELLDLLLVYFNLILNDNIITENKGRNLKVLKRIFRIKEGDFYSYRYDEVKEVLHRQFEHMYSDNKIDTEEALFKVGLQESFDLSYDQFIELANEDVKAALFRGASLSDLDTVFKLPEFTKVKADVSGRIISQEVKDLVWNRDGGKCAQCSSNARLEFDHIIPFSKGGSNTYRNIQLLCEQCNRTKTNSIG